jgi:hypothetical protein
MKHRRIILSTIVAFLVVPFAASTVLACSCADPSLQKKFRTADYVFLGTAVRITDSRIQYFANAVTFKVERQWKGSKLKEPLIHFTFDSPGMCGDLHLAEGQRFLIYAYREKQNLISYTDCGPNLQEKYADSEIRHLKSVWFRVFARLIPFD